MGNIFVNWDLHLMLIQFISTRAVYQ